MQKKEDILAQFDKKIKSQIKTHAEKGDVPKQVYLRENKVTEEVIDALMALKNGTANEIRLTPDVETNGNTVHEASFYFTFRALSGHEQISIDREMMDSVFDKNQEAYLLEHIAKTLSRATCANGTYKKPVFTPEDLLHSLTPSVLLYLGKKYEEFRFQCSPRLEEFTQAQINDIVDYLVKEEDQIKKFDFITSCSMMLMREIILALTDASVRDDLDE
jgi:hypothetical protein